MSPTPVPKPPVPAGSGLHKKIGGLPLYVWGGVLVAGLLLGLYLRSRGSSSSGSTAAPTTSYPLSVGTDGAGSLTDALAGGGLPASPAVGAVDPGLLAQLQNGQASSDQAYSTLTNQIQGVEDAIGSLVYSIPSSGGSGASPGTVDPYNPNPVTTTATKAQPRPAQRKAPAPVARKAPAPVPVKYFTFKKNVPLPKGKTLHFTKGKGYYAA